MKQSEILICEQIRTAVTIGPTPEFINNLAGFVPYESLPRNFGQFPAGDLIFHDKGSDDFYLRINGEVYRMAGRMLAQSLHSFAEHMTERYRGTTLMRLSASYDEVRQWFDQNHRVIPTPRWFTTYV